MLKNKPLSADERLVFKAEEEAQSEQITQNDGLRQWIDKEYSILMDQLSYVKANGRYSRDELNER
ncbi:MAG: hypothetical protein Q3M30_07480 [Candidatus Electrothrix sp. Rat3]|nr:hypothetical protein [Candidatus Electrothrix rattekaaiensis]